MKAKIILMFIGLVTLAPKGIAQVYFTKNGHVSFFSKAPLENISADNNQVVSVLNIQTGILQFSVLNNAFHFPKAMMEEHFNSDYMQSDIYSSSTFKGTVADMNKVDINKDDSYNVQINGELTVHGVTKRVTVPAEISIKNGLIYGKATFKILLKDYNIKIPSIVVNNISEMIDITVSCEYIKK